jgi:hypothetical protein
MSRAELFGLQHPAHTAVTDHRRHGLTAVPVDNADIVGSDAVSAIEYMRQERLAGERLQNFRQVRVHAGALARSEDDDT